MSQGNDAVYRVRVEQTGIDQRNEGEVSVTVSRPYDTLGAARGQATRVRAYWARSPYWETTITIERARGWETV